MDLSILFHLKIFNIYILNIFRMYRMKAKLGLNALNTNGIVILPGIDVDICKFYCYLLGILNARICNSELEL